MGHIYTVSFSRRFSPLHPGFQTPAAKTRGCFFLHTNIACSFKRSQQSVKGVNVLLWPQRIIIIILETVARPQMSNGYSGVDPSRQAKWRTVLNQPFFSDRVRDPEGAHTLSHSHAHTRTIKSNGVCPAAGKESPLMSGSHNDIIAVDGACWGILFHYIGMLQTSPHTARCWWWQKLVLTPELLVDAFDKKPQHVDSSFRWANRCYFQLESGFVHNKDRHRGALSKRLCCVITLSFWNSRQTALSFTRDAIWPKIFAPPLNLNQYQSLFNLNHECPLCSLRPQHHIRLRPFGMRTNMHATSVQAHN